MKFSKRDKKSTNFVVLCNPVNSEIWYCKDYNPTKIIDGVDYITVFKEENQNRTFLMRKDALRSLKN